MMRFSIVIPAYNYGHVLERAVVSACTQPGDDYEVLVIDDGSTDDTPTVLQDLQERYPSLRVIRQSNAGPAAARNNGIDSTTGKFLLFLDADDELLPNALEEIRRPIKSDGLVAVIIAPVISVFPDGRESLASVPVVSSCAEKRFLDYLYKDLRLCNGNGAVTIRRDLFDTVRYDVLLRQAEDIPVFAHCLALGNCVAVDKAVARIHKHADSRRHDLDAASQVGITLVNNVFDPEILPAKLMRHRKRYFARRSLSLFRTYYKAGQFAMAKRFYQGAVGIAPCEALRNPDYIIKYLRCLFVSK